MERHTNDNLSHRNPISLWFFPWRTALEEKNRASRYLNDGIKLAHELSDARRELSDAKDRMWSLECVVKSRDDMLDKLTKDLILAARSEAMATERAWHAVELAKILKARLAIYETPRGDDFSK